MPNKGVESHLSIPGSTLATWKKNKERFFESFQNSSLKWQRVNTGTYKKLNKALLKWFTSMRGNNIPINGPIRLEKTYEFATTFIYNNFAASSGWLKGWKERQMIFLSSFKLQFKPK